MIVVDPKALASYAILLPGREEKRKDGTWIRLDEVHQQGTALAVKFMLGTATSSVIRWARIPLRSTTMFPGYLVALVPF